MATYDITGHGMLSEKAKNLQNNDPATFDANVIAAEYIFDLNGTDYNEGAPNELVKLVLVYQLNYQLENDQQSEVYERVSEGDRTYNYKDKVGISPMAQRLANKLKQQEEKEVALVKERQKRGESGAKGSVVLW